MKMCFPHQIVNKDNNMNNSSQAKKIFDKKYTAKARLFWKPFQQSTKRLFELQ